MRSLGPQLLHKLSRHCRLLVPELAKTHVIQLLKYPCTAPLCSLRSPTRHFFTCVSLRKDVPQTQQTDQPVEKLDLDIWKSVMRSQVSMEEKPECVEEGLASQGPEDAGEDSSLEATRELVMMWRQAGKLVPENMKDEDLLALAKLTTKSSKKKYLKYLAIKEGHKKARKEKQEERKAKRVYLEDNRVKEGEEDMDDEGGQTLKNTFLLQFWSRSLDKLLAWRSAQSMVFGQPLVFDMSYEQSMAKREVENTVSQLLEVEGSNRRAKEPFHLHFCNLQPDSGYQRELIKRYGADAWERLLITASNQSYVDMFPPERLVYLTADSRNVLRTFDHSKVYIVGSLVDRSIQTGLSLANAKRLNLATARLPLDEFLHWEIGAKNLTLDQMIRILLTVKETGSWQEALEFVPKRKHDGFHPTQHEPQAPQSWQKKVWERQGPSSRPTSRMGNSEGTGRESHYTTRDPGFRGGDKDGARTVRDRDNDVNSGARDRRSSNTHKDTAGRRERDGTAWTGDENKPPSRVRTSLKSQMEEQRRSSGKKNSWWKDESP
ncbi:tRNA methyltransferase 10 homolog C isoform X1 [Hypomesus transpacificus]|uniref:tRNA methyltransferase 10 homolog C isoform X1 n=1 Tax=Hypomesus transpacificus TaxID=137520 RepID=UPI001F08263D|nr:tRNA methyltransferase 10 homolog C isoform X1 [Hypomesus transpacificus]